MYKLFDEFNKLSDYPKYMSDEAKAILNKGYLLKAGDILNTGEVLAEDETPKTAFMRVAQGVFDYIDNRDIALDLFEVLYNGYLGLATPVFTNFNAERGLPISCFLVHVGDNIESIYGQKLTLAQLSKHGGGTAVSLSDIRPTGSPIKHGGTSTGVLPWAREYDLTASVITQGSTRRGNVAIYLDIEHPDLKYLLLAKDHTQGDSRQFIDANLGVTVSDKFIKEMINGDENKKALFSEVLMTRLKTGSPYIVYLDNANKQNPPEYKTLGLSVSMSNLCLTGDTLVATKQGSKPIKNLVGKEVTIFDGDNWVKNNNFFYMGVAPVIEVRLFNGCSIKMTLDHRCLIQKGEDNYYEVRAKDLKIGDILSQSKHNNFHMRSNTGFKVKDIKILKDSQDVYCTKVPTTQRFALANGVLTGNCSEIFLHTDPEHTAVCCLSSLNIATYDEWIDFALVSRSGLSVPQLGVILLDAVMEEFINKGSKIKGIESAVRFAQKSRALG